MHLIISTELLVPKICLPWTTSGLNSESLIRAEGKFLQVQNADLARRLVMLPRSFRYPSVKQSLQDRTDIWRKVTI